MIPKAVEELGRLQARALEALWGLVKKAFSGDPLRMFRHPLEARIYSEAAIEKCGK